MKKKKWSRPECCKVKLVPEEAVLTGCKVKFASGPGGPNCDIAGQQGQRCSQKKS